MLVNERNIVEGQSIVLQVSVSVLQICCAVLQCVPTHIVGVVWCSVVQFVSVCCQSVCVRARVSESACQPYARINTPDS